MGLVRPAKKREGSRNSSGLATSSNPGEPEGKGYLLVYR